MALCRFHPLSPNYIESNAGDFIVGPVGRYPCCGQKAFRFETFPESNVSVTNHNTYMYVLAL